MAAGFNGLLGLTGVWPARQPNSGGYRGALELTGVWPSSEPQAPATQAGFVGLHQLSGVWITGAAVVEVPPVVGGGGGSTRRSHTPSKNKTPWPTREQLEREDEEIIAIVLMAFELGLLS